MKPLVALLLAAGCLALWVVLAFVMAVPNGWVHLPLAVGAVLIAVAIIQSSPAETGHRTPGTGL
jgi:1,4-dihydroxy-2-naphthoate octaprenyltransferase